MADFQFVDFALIPSPVRKEKQFRLPDDFSEFDFTVLSRTSHSVFGFSALFRVFTSRTDRCSAMRKMVSLRSRGIKGRGWGRRKIGKKKVGWGLFLLPPSSPSYACYAGYKMVLHDESEARNFNISALRGRNRRLLATLM